MSLIHIEGRPTHSCPGPLRLGLSFFSVALFSAWNALFEQSSEVLDPLLML